jgi:ribosomal subunit interface protein
VQVEIATRNYKATKRVRESIDDKTERFEKYGDLDTIRVTLGVENLDHICEIHLRSKGHDFHSSASSDDMLVSVDRSTDALEKQLRRHKRKTVDGRRSHGSSVAKTSAAALEAVLDAEGAQDEGTDEEY